MCVLMWAWSHHHFPWIFGSHSLTFKANWTQWKWRSICVVLILVRTRMSMGNYVTSWPVVRKSSLYLHQQVKETGKGNTEEVVTKQECSGHISSQDKHSNNNTHHLTKNIKNLVEGGIIGEEDITYPLHRLCMRNDGLCMRKCQKKSKQHFVDSVCLLKRTSYEVKTVGRFSLKS